MSNCAREGCKKRAMVCLDCIDQMDEDLRLIIWAMISRIFHVDIAPYGDCWIWTRRIPDGFTYVTKPYELNDELREILRKERDVREISL